MDWTGRIDDLCDHLTRLYGVEDRPMVEVLLAALVPCRRIAPPWIILETNWHAPDCYGGWFCFGGEWLPKSLESYRGRKPWRQTEEELAEILQAPGDERLFIEPYYETYPRFPRLAQSLFVMDRCLRVRYKRPRTGAAIPALDEWERDQRIEQLNYLARKVLDDPTGARTGNPPPKFNPPENFLYHLELVQRMTPWWRDWETLVKNFGALAVRHAWLTGREETGPEQTEILARVAHDSIPPWIHKALSRLAWTESRNKTLLDAMQLHEERYRTGHGAKWEVSRMRQGELIEWNWKKLTWRIHPRHRQAILDLIHGCAFGRERPKEAQVS